MPLYEGLSLGSDKHSVVIEFGHAFTKCGFASDYSPRAIIRSEIYYKPFDQVLNVFSIKDEKHLSFCLKAFIEMIYFRFLAVNPKDRRVIIIENLFYESTFRKILADVLFKHFDIPALLFVPQHLTALMTLMIQSGLIVDVGYTECIVTPVIEGVTNFDSVQFAPLGGKAIHESILCELRKLKAKIKTSNETTILSDDFTLDDKILENIKVRTCFVAPFERREYLRKNDSENIENSPRDVQYPIDGSRILELPGVVREKAAEILFEEFENEQSIATLILDALLRCPLDSRKILASNIVLVGGSCMLPGFKYRLMMELKHLVNHPRYKEKIFFKSFLFHNPPCKENYVSWLGASIFGSTDAINTRCISREQYLKTNGKVLVDWCDWYPPKNSIVDMFYSLNEKYAHSLRTISRE